MITFEKDGLIKSDEAIKNLAENPSQVTDFPLPASVKPYKVMTTGYFRQIPYTGQDNKPYSITLALCYLESQLLEIPCNGEKQIRVCENEDTPIFIRVTEGATRKRVNITGVEKLKKPSEEQPTTTVLGTPIETAQVSETALNPNSVRIAKIKEDLAKITGETTADKAKRTRLTNELSKLEPATV